MVTWGTTATVAGISHMRANGMRCSLGDAARDRLSASTGDIVLVTGNGRLLVRVGSGHPLGEDDGVTVGLNSLHRESLDVDIGETVGIKECEPAPATTVQLQAGRPMCRPFGPEDPELLRTSLLQRPVLAGGHLWAMSEACQQFGVVPGEWHPLRVVDTDPDGPVYINDETTITGPGPRIPEVDDAEPGPLQSSWEELRATVLDRDNATCQVSGCRTDDPAELDIHFIVPPSTRGTIEPDNCITLCIKCHEATHNRRYTPTW